MREDRSITTAISQKTEAQGPPFIQPIVEPFQSFIHAEAAGGIVLLAETGRHRRQHLARSLAQGGTTIQAPWLECKTCHGEGLPDPAEHILTLAKRQRADLIALGSRGVTGFTRILLGSVSREVARHAPCSVLVVRPTRR